MSEAMVREKGLLNYAQAALLLDVSTKRISELVRTGKLKRFDFLGRTYVYMREVGERYQQDLKAGRPPQSVGKRAVASVKAAFKTDRVQPKLAVIMETELWPNHIHQCAKRGVPVALANARLSERSAKGYGRFPKLTQPMLAETLRAYPNATEVVWVQEEPRNMGAWPFLHEPLAALLSPNQKLRYAGRPVAAAPATGSHHRHEEQQKALVEGAVR